jgi:UDP-N-acetylglucosamine 1-carboxyvinyltransferase
MVAIRPPIVPGPGRVPVMLPAGVPPGADGFGRTERTAMTVIAPTPVAPVALDGAPSRRMVVTGGARLVGEITTNGAKNAATKMMASALLTRDPVVLENVPNIQAVQTQAALLRAVGAIVEYDVASHRMTIVADHIVNERLPAELAARERVPFVLVGPMLARHGIVDAPKPGGCNIGERKTDIALRGFEAMGAEIIQQDGSYLCQTTGLRGARIYLDYPSHTGTENLMMAACLANGTSVIMNAACDPEIVGLAEHLARMGAMIRGAGTPKIEVVGVPQLRGARTWVMPDRMEAGSFAIAAAATGGDLVIRRVVPEHLESVIYKLNECGAEVYQRDDAILVRRVKPLHGVEIQTIPYPGFPTDLQTPFCALLTQAQGTSIIHERVFEDRFRYVDQFRLMGANIETNGEGGASAYATKAVIHGPTALHGADVEALDLRSGIALVIAGLAASGQTTIHNFAHAERGYEDVASRFRSLGAELTAVDDN